MADPREWTPLMNAQGDYEVSGGRLVRDYTVSSRCRMRLSARRGQWAYDPDFGSRLHEVKAIREARRMALPIVVEALQPLIDEGSILGVTLGEVESDDRTGLLGVEVFIALPQSDVLESLGLYRIGV